MKEFIDLMIQSGETGVNISLYSLLPVMVIMMAFMRTLEDRGILQKIAVKISPLLIIFGLPGLGAFAIIQILFINFAAPIVTLKLMENNEGITKSMIAATLAAILVMSQANATFPLMVAGLNFPITVITSLVGGLTAGFIAYRLARKEESNDAIAENSAALGAASLETAAAKERKSLLQLLFSGGEEGMQIVLKSIPPLILALFLVNVFRKIGVINIIEQVMSPVLTRIGIPGVAVLPIVTKYLAGGTAMLAVTMDLVNKGLLSVVELNRIAGFTMNPLDPVGVAILVSAGPRTASVIKPAIKAAIIGIVLRSILHLIIFR